MRSTFDRVSGLTTDQRGVLAEQFDRAARIAGAEPVAVVGIGCRFPGGGVGPDNYWRFLAGGGDAIGEVPPDRWDADALYDPDPLTPGRMPSKWGGFLSDIAGFDAEFFGITPREAEAMDPQQRVLLEVAWESLEHAGMAPDRLAGTRAGVFMGVYYNEYQTDSTTNPEAIDAYSATGNAHSVTVGRIAYLLGLRGPAVALDTACSSSLVAVHLACQNLRARESDLALAGGVSLILRPETQLALAKWGMLSPTGRCHAFDAGADGFVRGEGAGVVVLKRLTDAVRDGNRVLAVIRGSAVNQDGRSNGLTAPNEIAQRDVITRALTGAEIPPATVGLVETHGTGTSLGDPIEFGALAAVYGSGEHGCALGAVKTNMGHLEAAAGIAGFIKTVLALQKGLVPPNLHFTQWNSAIDPARTRLLVPTGAPIPWPVHAGPRRAAVSSFGLSGTNAHIVLEQGLDTAPAPTSRPRSAVTTLVLSGKSASRVAEAAGSLADWIAGQAAVVPLTDISDTLERRRGRHRTVAAVCARDRDEAVAHLRALAAGQSRPGVVAPHDGVDPGAGTVFVYSGQGAQWAGMGRQLLADEPAFAAAIDQLEPVFVDKAGFSLREVLDAGTPVTGIARIQPVLVGMQLALTQLWRSYGVEPDAVIGQSMGEVTAAVVAHALTPAEGIQVIATRSRLMSRLSGRGAMAMLELAADDAEALIAGRPEVTVAVDASPRQSVIAGPPDQIDELVGIVDRRGLLARRIDVEVASHHPAIDPILAELHTALVDLAPRTATIPVLYTTAGTDGEPKFDAVYWVANVRRPVRLRQAVAAAGARYRTFVEISPHPLLTHAVAETLGSRVSTVATTYRDQPETLAFHTSLATIRPRAGATSPDGPSRLADIPPTPWQHTRYWPAARPAVSRMPGHHPLLGVHVALPSGDAHVWQGDVGLDLNPWLADHRVHGQPVLPAAAFVEMALAAGCVALGETLHGVMLHRIEVEQMLTLDRSTPVTTQLLPERDGAMRVEIHSQSAGGAWTRHAVGRICRADSTVEHPPDRPKVGSGAALAPTELYAALRHTGAHHGTAFAALTGIVRLPGSWSDTVITLPDEAYAHHGFRLHPVLLDAALQSLAAAMPDATPDDTGETTYLPLALSEIRVFGDVGRRARCRADLVGVDGGGDAVGRLTISDESGVPAATITGVYLRRVQRSMVPLPMSAKTFQTVWDQTAGPSGDPTALPAAASGSWLVLAGSECAAAAEEFAAGFAGPGRRVVLADLHHESAVLAAFAGIAADPDLPPAGVVIFPDPGRADAGDLDTALDAGRLSVWAISVAVKAIIGGWHGSSPRLWLVTRDGLAVDGTAGDPATGSLRGLIRVLAYEHPDLRATLLDLEAGADAAAVFSAELLCPAGDDVVAWRGSTRLVEKLARAALPTRGRTPVVRPGGSYVVTGGLGGVGMTVARWLVARGAGRVVLNGRSELSDRQRQDVADLAVSGDVVVVHGDIADPGVAEELVRAAETSGKPLRGVIHSAAVLDDQLLTELTEKSLHRVWAPKAAGGLRLHEATVGHELDWWVGFSSVASLLGSPGQAAYAGANAWLDALADWRRAAGLPATVINWGQWSDVGLARTLTLDVLDPITPAEGIEALESVLACDCGRIGVARLRLDRAAVAFPEIRRLGYFACLTDELTSDNHDDDWIGLDAVTSMPADDAGRAIMAQLRRRISGIMGYYGEAAIEPDRSLTELGIDSLMAVRIRNTIRGDFGIEPPVALLLQGASLADLATHLIDELHLAGPVTGAPANPIRDRTNQRAAARQQAASRRKVRQRT